MSLSESRSRPAAFSVAQPRWYVVAGTGARELLLLGALYLGYSMVRVAALGDLGEAFRHAELLLDLERTLHLDAEHPLNDLVARHEVLAVPASFYYAIAHYLVTPAVLLWLWLRRPSAYLPARRALVAATLAALTVYVLLPTAPPRLFGGYHDVLAQTADVGWWSTSASAPRGLGGLTNELAAMPSMHVGWAVWCALTLTCFTARRWVSVLGWVYAGLTTLVVIGTGNHWTLDAAVGALLVILAWVALVGADSDEITRQVSPAGRKLLPSPPRSRRSPEPDGADPGRTPPER